MLIREEKIEEKNFNLFYMNEKRIRILYCRKEKKIYNEYNGIFIDGEGFEE